MQVINYTCDTCGGPIPIRPKTLNIPEHAENLVVEVKQGFEFQVERCNGRAEDWDDQHVCKYCFIDAVNRLDDRDQRAEG